LFGVCAFDLNVMQEGRARKNKGKFFLCLIKYHAMKTYGEYIAPRALDMTPEDRMAGTRWEGG
jgi:hypothetical protein